MDTAILVPAVSVAGAIVGALITGFVTRRKDISESAIQALTILVEKQESQINRLDERLDKLEAQYSEEEERHRETKRKKRLQQERYSVAISFVGALLSAAKVLFHRLDMEGVVHANLIPIPELIATDVYQQFPELAETGIPVAEGISTT